MPKDNEKGGAVKRGLVFGAFGRWFGADFGENSIPVRAGRCWDGFPVAAPSLEVPLAMLEQAGIMECVPAVVWDLITPGSSWGGDSRAAGREQGCRETPGSDSWFNPSTSLGSPALQLSCCWGVPAASLSQLL